MHSQTSHFTNALKMTKLLVFVTIALLISSVAFTYAQSQPCFNDQSHLPLISGTDDNNDLPGTEDSERICGHDGNDTIWALGGDDWVHGNQGADSLDAGSGDDVIQGGKGGDILYGRSGQDTLYGDLGPDRLEGGSGDDNYVFRIGDGHDVISDESGDDTIWFQDFTNPLLANYQKNGNDLIITYGSDSVHVLDYFANGTIEHIHFGDSDQPANNPPYGNFDPPVGTLLTGWTTDANQTMIPINTHLYIYNGDGSLREIRSAPADKFRGDMLSAGVAPTENTRFKFEVSDLPPGDYSFNVYGIDAEGDPNKNVLLGNSPRALTIVNRDPVGTVYGITADFVLEGEAHDLDTPSQAVQIHVYVDGPAGIGHLIDATTTEVSTKQFRYIIPLEYHTGFRPIYVYAINTTPGNNPKIGGPIPIPSLADGDAEISNIAGPSSIVIKVTNRLAGAIYSIIWNFKEFINSTDHGRELQSSINLNLGEIPIRAETYNPTEAGSRSDGTGPTSSSILQGINASGNMLETQTKMAFWLRPGEESCGEDGCFPANNTTIVSDHILNKKVTIGFQGMAHVIEYLTQFTIPDSEVHTHAVFEAVTGYMPAEFSVFRTYNPITQTLAPLSDGPGEQELPVILATPDENYAMGVYSPDLPQPEFPGSGYGRFRFSDQEVVKWNCVFREGNYTTPIPPGPRHFRSYVIVGSLQNVTVSMDQLHAYFNQPLPEVSIIPTNLNVSEDGASGTYKMMLASQPTADVVVTVSPDSDIEVSNNTLTFTTSDWNAPQTVTVTAVNDNVVEGEHTGIITHSAASNDTNYNGIAVDSVTATIQDAALPFLEVIQYNLVVPAGSYYPVTINYQDVDFLHYRIHVELKNAFHKVVGVDVEEPGEVPQQVLLPIRAYAQPGTYRIKVSAVSRVGGWGSPATVSINTSENIVLERRIEVLSYERQVHADGVFRAQMTYNNSDFSTHRLVVELRDWQQVVVRMDLPEPNALPTEVVLPIPADAQPGIYRFKVSFVSRADGWPSTETYSFHTATNIELVAAPAFELVLPEGISLIHIPLEITEVNEQAMQIHTVGDLYDAFGGAVNVSLLMTYQPPDMNFPNSGWQTFLADNISRGSAADRTLTEDMGIISVMKQPVTLSLRGHTPGTDGVSEITLKPGANLIGLPLMDPQLERVSDLLNLEGFAGRVTSVIVLDPVDATFKTVSQPGDPGDIDIVGGQSFFVVANEEATASISGEPWTSSPIPAGPPVTIGYSRDGQTPILVLHGEIRKNTGPQNLTTTDLRVTVTRLSTGKVWTTSANASDDIGDPRFAITLVDVVKSRAAEVGDLLEINVETPDSRIGFQPLRYIVTEADVKASQIRLPNLTLYEIPAKTILLSNYPNPFNPETWVPYRLAEDASVTLTIYDIAGRLVRHIEVGHKLAAVYDTKDKAIYWNGRNDFSEHVASGVYFYTLTADDFSATRQMLILK